MLPKLYHDINFNDSSHFSIIGQNELTGTLPSELGAINTLTAVDIGKRGFTIVTILH